MFNVVNILMALAVLFAVAFPIGLLLVWRRRTGARLLPFFVGMIVFVLFVMVLESLTNDFVLKNAGAISNYLKGNDLAYVIYGSVIAGLFEETGRFLAFKTVLRRHTEKATAVTYGIGHGGCEVLLLFGLGYALLLAAKLTNGAGTFAGLLQKAEQLTSGGILLAVAERVFAMAAHIGLSVFVFFAVWDAKRLWYYPLAIWLHALIDAPAVLAQRELLGLWQTEAIIAVLAALILLAAIWVYRKYRDVPIKQQQKE